jgi:HlyD family secretion protein
VRAEATLRDLTAQRERVAAQLADAKRTLDRQTELIARNIASQAGFDTARTAMEVQKATLDSVEAQIASQKAELVGLEADIALAEAQTRSAEAAILQKQAKLRDAEIDLARTDVKSPVDGVVVQRNIDLGQTVAASLSAPTLFTIAQDLREIEVWANIDEADVGRLKSGQPASFLGQRLPGPHLRGPRPHGAPRRPDGAERGHLHGRHHGPQRRHGAPCRHDREPAGDDRRASRRAARPNAALRFRRAGRRALTAAAGAGAGPIGHALRRPARRPGDRGASRAPRCRGEADAGNSRRRSTRSWPRPGELPQPRSRHV